VNKTDRLGKIEPLLQKELQQKKKTVFGDLH